MQKILYVWIKGWPTQGWQTHKIKLTWVQGVLCLGAAWVNHFSRIVFLGPGLIVFLVLGLVMYFWLGTGHWVGHLMVGPILFKCINFVSIIANTTVIGLAHQLGSPISINELQSPCIHVDQKKKNSEYPPRNGWRLGVSS